MQRYITTDPLSPDSDYLDALTVLDQQLAPALSRSGIYGIACDSTGDVYVGLTQQAFLERFRRHWERLNNGQHPNRRLQALWTLHGSEAFSFCVLEQWGPPEPLARLKMHERVWAQRIELQGGLLNNYLLQGKGLPASIRRRLTAVARFEGVRTGLIHAQLLDEALRQHGF